MSVNARGVVMLPVIGLAIGEAVASTTERRGMAKFRR